MLSEEKVAIARPPYRSSWPIEYVSKDDLAKYVDDYNGHVFQDQIASSAGSEGPEISQNTSLRLLFTIGQLHHLKR